MELFEAMLVVPVLYFVATFVVTLALVCPMWDIFHKKLFGVGVFWVIIQRRHDQHRAAGVFDDRFGYGGLQQGLPAGQGAGAGDDHVDVQFFGGVHDRGPDCAAGFHQEGQGVEVVFLG